MASPTEIRKGNVIMYQEHPHLVLNVDHRTPGRRAGFVQATLRNLKSNSSVTVKFKSSEEVVFCHVESHALEFSYIDNQGYHFMNTETFEDIVLSAEIVSEQKEFLIENTSYSIMFVNDKPIQLQLPASVSMKVAQASEGLRGDSVSNAQKPVVTQTGLTIQAPLFIKTGDIIRINTDDKTYLGRG